LLAGHVQSGWSLFNGLRSPVRKEGCIIPVQMVGLRRRGHRCALFSADAHRARLSPMPRDVPSPPAHQRAHGRATLHVTAAYGRTRIADLFQAAPLRWLFPDVEADEPMPGALVNVAGGLAGGDSLDIALRLDTGAAFTATTPAAEKLYRSLGPATVIRSRVEVAGSAVCEWLPQETILFDRARLDRRLTLELEPESRLLAAELLVLGRAAHGEQVSGGSVLDAWRVRRGGRLIWADALRLSDPRLDTADRFALAGANAAATLLLAVPDAAAHRDLARDCADGAASLVAPGLLVARWLGEAGAVRSALGAAICRLRAAALGHPPRLPRLWRT
jgi:urease accessory protein